MKSSIFLGVVMGLAIILCSCARIPTKPPSYPSERVISKPTAPSLRGDIIHVVAPGETIWRISKMYNVKAEDIMQINNLKRPQDLKMGQRLFIPQAAPLKSIITLYPSYKWKHIILHHSATDEGNAFCFHRAHRFRGWNTLGYHFVINNGSRGKEDGNIEVSPRWIKQQDGAHCKASDMNRKAIGICLVGNFNIEKVTKKQMDSLVNLVNILRKYYNIPIKNIKGHNEVPGAKTECPGKYFPWEELKGRLKVSK